MKFSQSERELRPRQCDCEFCQSHQAAYVSDPRGQLEIHIEFPEQIERHRQGASLAEFLICQRCGDLIGVTYASQQKLFAAINAKICESVFGEPVVVSPKKLSPTEKTSRWTDVWFADVRIR